MTAEVCKFLGDNGIRYAFIEKYKEKAELIVHPEDRKKLMKVMKQNGFKALPHPLGKDYGYKLLYQMHDFLLYVKKDFFVEISFELRCMSLMPKMWMPLDKSIQASIWSEVKYAEEGYACLNDENMLVYVLVRSLFWKKQYYESDINAIKDLFSKVDKKVLADKFEVVFFKFGLVLMELLEQGQYDQIIERYHTYMDY